MAKLVSLRSLDLSNNKIGLLPAAVTSLTSLRKLIISGNPMTSLPLSMGIMTNLKRLDFDPHENWKSPPASVMMQGSEAALAFLHAVESSQTSGRLVMPTFPSTPLTHPRTCRS